MATLSSNEKNFLKNLVKSVRPSLTIAWLLTVISTLLFILQSWFLAALFSNWLTNYFNKTPLSTGLELNWLYGLTICFIVRPLLNMGRDLISSRASLKVRKNLRESLLNTMSQLGPNLRYFGSDGSLSTKIIDQTDALDGYIKNYTVQKNVTVSTPIMLLIAVAWQSKFSAALLLLTAPLVPVFMILIGHLTARKSAAQFNALSQLSGRFMDWIRGMPTLKRLQATHIAEQDLSFSSEEYRRRTMDVLKIAFLNGAVLELLAALSIALVAVYLGFGLMGILPWDKGNIPVGYFGALFILLLAPEFYVPLRQLGADYHSKALAEGAVQSLLPLIKAGNDAKIDFGTSNNINNHTDSNIDLSQAFGLEITDLSIQAPITLHKDEDEDENQQHRVTSNKVTPKLGELDSNSTLYRTRLMPISFKIAPGERVALVGESGSGKSSLLQALMGFIEYQGTIKLITNSNKNYNNGASYKNFVEHQTPVNKTSNNEIIPQSIEFKASISEISELSIEQLRTHIGYLAQRVALMPLSIVDNLRLANSNATDEQIIDVLQVVGLWKLIQRLPNGLNTKLGESGKGLSGGQQQRLGIAQLLLRNDSLWLLDEPTEHLDPDTANHIHNLLEKVSRGKTVIWVTHAYEQLGWIDNIITLKTPKTIQDNIESNKAVATTLNGGKL